MPKMPKGWKTVPLGSILDQDQITQTLQIMQRPVSDAEKTKMLKEYYGSLRQQLEAKGFDPDFLAYAIPYWIGQSAEQEAEHERRESEKFAQEFIRGRRN
jgi:hypothetical protein